MYQNKRFLSLAALLLISGAASSQSLNIDVGPAFPLTLPDASYGAAAGQTGQWQLVRAVLTGPITLMDLNGNPTSATVTSSGGFGDFGVGNPAWSGEDENLMEDGGDVGGTWQGAPGGSITWTFANLMAGTYSVYTYALAPDQPAVYRTRVAVTGAAEAPQIVGGAWSGSPHVQGISYALHTVTIAAGQNLVVVTSDPGSPGGNLATVNGFQLVRGTASPFALFCAGDGSATACPCANGSPAGANVGCLNSLGVGGRLRASGAVSLSADTALLSGQQMPDSTALYFQGTTRANGGMGSLFGDGLRCAGGTIIRLATKLNVGGASQFPGGGDPTLSVKGAVLAPGTRTYQIWYRNAASFCTPDTFNLSNGVEITWAP